ncbi:MAG: TolC family protein, partial [Comamonadaceae bacterium]|nr:TolC family protein [Comamonadaceae bacterium]
ERVVGLYLSLPLGSAGREADAHAAQAQADMAAQALEQVRQRVALDAQQRAHEAVNSLQQLAQQRQALAQLQESATLQERAYALGETPLMELLQAQRSALEARQLADSAALDALQAQARLQLDAHLLWAPPQHRHPHHDGAEDAPGEGHSAGYAPR